MKRAIAVWMTISLMAQVGVADVAGEKIERLGMSWKKASFKSWLVDEKALLAPEVVNLAVQACFRSGQEKMDRMAYYIARLLTAEMGIAFKDADDRMGIGLSRLTGLLHVFSSVRAKDAKEYRTQCEAKVSEYLASSETRDELEPLFRGRMKPVIPDALPASLKEPLLKMERKGIRLSRLTWDGLVEQVCTLEGYYSTSNISELWVLFSTTRAMANVLPADEDSAEFTKRFFGADRVVGLIRKLNVYSSVAGRYNGPSIGMNRTEWAKAGMRLTGPALGSRAVSLMAFFTTPWRERLQATVIDQEYPEAPFQLLSSYDVLNALMDVGDPYDSRVYPSATEWGMHFLRDHMFDHSAGEYGDVTVAYRKANAIAWLALNAETNVRQNEKIAGYEKVSFDPDTVTTAVYGTREDYRRIARQLGAARRAYRALSPDGKFAPECVTNLESLVTAAREALGEKPTVAVLRPEDTASLKRISIEPVIVDIGLEVDDVLGAKPEGVHRLHLATGRGRSVEVAIQGKTYRLWTPSAIVWHADRVLTTAEWRAGALEKLDPIGR